MQDNILKNKDIQRHAFCVAPMLDWTDSSCRVFHRLISQHALLYTEMVTTGAILHGDAHRHLQFNSAEHPLALQLGGSQAEDLALCTRMAEDYGYAEVNLNVGCPSDRVQNGRFGACLMAAPTLVAECVAAMRQASQLPITVKCRIGIDEQDSYAELQDFIRTVEAAGCSTFIVHARKAWLSGLSPKQNREIPPLRYEVVFKLKQDFPELEIILNGGILSVESGKALLTHVDGVMLGREVYHNPYILAEVDQIFYGDSHPIASREEIVQAYLPYLEAKLQQGVKLISMTRHILGLFHGQAGARAWRRYLSEQACKNGAGTEVVLAALALTAQAISPA